MITLTSPAVILPKKSLGLLANLGIAILALTGVITMQWTKLQQKSLSNLTPQQAEQQESIRLRLLSRSPSLGFGNLIADWTFLGFVQYFGDNDARKQTGYYLSVDYFDLVTKLDPHFIEVYPVFSTAVSFYLGKPETTIKFIDRSLVVSSRLIPKSYVLWVYKGLDQLLLLGDIPGAIKSYEMAAKWLQGTPDENLAKYFQLSANFLKKNPHSISVRFLAWNEIYQQAIDQKTKERAKQEMLKLGAQIEMTQDGEIRFVLPPALMEK